MAIHLDQMHDCDTSQFTYARNKKAPDFSGAFPLEDGGEGGIRTLDTLPYTHFPGVLLQPLGQLTVFFVYRERFPYYPFDGALL